MDTSGLEKVTSVEEARESLIAISFSVPDTILASTAAAETFSSGDEVAWANGNISDEFRAKLISISYIQSQDLGLHRCNGHL